LLPGIFWGFPSLALGTINFHIRNAIEPADVAAHRAGSAHSPETETRSCRPAFHRERRRFPNAARLASLQHLQ